MHKKFFAKRITAFALAFAMSISLPGVESIPYMYNSSSVVQAAESSEIYSNQKELNIMPYKEWTTCSNPNTNEEIKEEIVMKADISMTQDVYDSWISNNTDLEFRGVIQCNDSWDWYEGKCTVTKADFANNTISVSFELQSSDKGIISANNSITAIKNIQFNIKADGLRGKTVSVKNLKLSSKSDENLKNYYSDTDTYNIIIPTEWNDYDYPNNITAKNDFIMTADISMKKNIYETWNNTEEINIEGQIKYDNDWKSISKKQLVPKNIFNIDNDNYKTSIQFEFKLTDMDKNEIEIKEIDFKIAVNGLEEITINNVKILSESIEGPSTPDNPDIDETLKDLYEFNNGLEGWKQDSGYTSEGVVNTVTHDTDKLKMQVDYSSVSEKEWQNACIYFANSDSSKLNFEPYNYLSFDLYYEDSKKTKGDLLVKIDSNVNNQNLFGDQMINFNNLDFRDEGDGLKKATFGFSIDQELAKTINPDKIDIVIVGNKTDYNGIIYIDNIKFEYFAPEKVTGWDFAQEKGKWIYDNDSWKDQNIDFTGSVDYDSAGQRLQANIDYSKLSDKGWAQVGGISYSNKGGLSFVGYNQLSFDFYYKAPLQGNISIKPVAEYKSEDKKKNLFVGDQSQSVNNLTSVDDKDGYKKVRFEFVLDENSTENAFPEKLLFVLIGNNTNYNGAVYFDNIKLETIDKGYKESTVSVNSTTNVSTTSTELKVNNETKQYTDNIKLVDSGANDETKALYQYLKAIGESSSVIYGHMEDTVLKAGNPEFTYSDTEDVTGSISAIDGLDCGSLFSGFAQKYVDRHGKDNEAGVVIDDATFADDVKAAALLSNESIEKGAIITLSSHLPNFAYAQKKSNADSFEKAYDKYDYTIKDSYELTGDCMNNILPGGKFNDAYTSYLDLIAEYAKQVNGPVLFRPLHENTGSWFWWGKAFCDAETYKSVFKYTVDYLRDDKNVHNFLYLYGPGSEAASEAEYEERYPGDNYVDMVGFDSYDAKPSNSESYTFMKNFENTVKLTNSFAQKHNKLFAVTETGISNDSFGLLPKDNPRKDWYMEILDIVTKSEYNCCYFMLWSNYSSNASYYTPFVVKKNGEKLYGHEMLDNFIKFYNDKRSIFADDQKGIVNSFSTITAPSVTTQEIDGYITSPVSGSRILEETTITARLNIVTDKIVSLRAAGNGKTVELAATKNSTGKIYTATITKENLDTLGKTADGKIGLYIDNKLYQEINIIFNIEERKMLPEQVDDFESYSGLLNLLLGKWATNKDSGCTVDLSLVKDPCYEGEYALKFAYNEIKTGWAGATMPKEADWSSYDALKFWVKPDGKNQKTVIQITTSAGTYEAYLNLYPEYANATTPLLVTLPFSEFKSGNNILTGEALKKMSSFGLWVNAIGDSSAFANGEDTVSGELYYDDIRAVSTGIDKPVFEVVEETEPEKPDNPDNTSTEVKEDQTTIKDNVGEASLGNTDFTSIQEDIKKDVASALKDLLSSSLTQEEKNKAQEAIDAINKNEASIDISLKVDKKSDGIDAIVDEDERKENNIKLEEIKKEVQSSNSGATVEVKAAMTLDISLFSICKYTQNNNIIVKTSVNELTKPVKISMKLPDSIPAVKNGAVRTYYIICLHKNKNGKIEPSKVKCDYDKNNNSISFDGSKFSTYVLCYADVTPKSTDNSIILGGSTSGGSGSSGSGTVISTATPIPTATPSAKPSSVPSTTATPIPSERPSVTDKPSVTDHPVATNSPEDNSGTNLPKVKKGTKFVAKGINYEVTSVSGTKTVKCMGAKKNIKKVVIPAAVKIRGKKYNVTFIAKNAFKDNKKLIQVTIGKNIISIGKNAFKGCKNLKKIIVKTKKLTDKKVGSNAFKGINSKAIVKVPKGKIKTYKKIIRAKGAGKKVTFKK